MSGPAGPARGVTATLVATVLVTLAGLLLTVLEWNSLALTDAAGDVGALAGTVAYTVLGVLIVRRAGGNLVGWFMLVEGTATAVMTAGSAYAIYGVKARPGAFPAAAAVGALAEAVFVITAMNLAAIFLVFPTGRLPSPRWRPAAVVGVALTGLSVASFVVSTRRVALPAVGGISLGYPNRWRSGDTVGDLARHPERAGPGVPAGAGGRGGLAGAAVPARRPAAAPADEMAGAGFRRDAADPGGRRPGHRVRPGAHCGRASRSP